MKLVPVILSGGAGSRLWPMSHQAGGKPLIELADGLSLLQHAFKRAAGLEHVVEILTVTSQSRLWVTTRKYAGLGRPDIARAFLLEPMSRGTAAAVAAASIDIEATHGPGTLVLVMPADHVIRDQKSFTRSVARALHLASSGRLVTFGIAPTRPETAYGYIEADGEDVRRFVEKPDMGTARRFIDSGIFYWNAGLFCFEARSMIALMAKLCPDILDQCRMSLASARRSVGPHGRRIEIDADAFAKVRETSIDYAVLEKAAGTAMVACGFDWSDVGSWDAFASLREVDRERNSSSGNTIIEDSSGTTILASKRIVAAVGLKDIIIVDTPDALLVAAKEKAQSVKKVHESLQAQGRSLAPKDAMECPWGRYCVLDEGPAFKVKRLEIEPGAKLSLQSHRFRSEHLTVVRGAIVASLDGTSSTLGADQSAYVPPGCRHRLENPFAEPAMVIEVQTGTRLDEDDIIRYEDIYDRSCVPA